MTQAMFLLHVRFFAVADVISVSRFHDRCRNCLESQVCSPYHLLHRRLGDLLKRRSRQRRRFWNWDGSAGSDSHFVHLARATRFKAENESSNFSWLLPEKKTGHPPCVRISCALGVACPDSGRHTIWENNFSGRLPVCTCLGQSMQRSISRECARLMHEVSSHT